jgi:hypothetical protein
VTVSDDVPGQDRDVPQLPLSLNDMAVLDHMIAAYLAYLQGASQLARKHTAQVAALQRLRVRLRDVSSAAASGERFLLTFSEAETLDQAIAGFARLCRSTFAPSKERDEALAQCERLRHDIELMLYGEE